MTTRDIWHCNKCGYTDTEGPEHDHPVLGGRCVYLAAPTCTCGSDFRETHRGHTFDCMLMAGRRPADESSSDAGQP